jgi:hypothetical protein
VVCSACHSRGNGRGLRRAGIGPSVWRDRGAHGLVATQMPLPELRSGAMRAKGAASRKNRTEGTLTIVSFDKRGEPCRLRNRHNRRRHQRGAMRIVAMDDSADRLAKVRDQFAMLQCWFRSLAVLTLLLSRSKSATCASTRSKAADTDKILPHLDDLRTCKRFLVHAHIRQTRVNRLYEISRKVPVLNLVLFVIQHQV